MLITEYRIPLPLTVQEYQVGQLYSTIEMSKSETGGGEGVEILKNEPFYNLPLLSNQYSEGQYTYKVYHMAQKVPAFIRNLTPQGALELHEEAWNSFPYCKTELTNPGFIKDGFSINIYTHHFNDKGEQDNVHSLSLEQLRKRNIVYMDIVNDPIVESSNNLANDPSSYKSIKTGRGPFTGNWVETTKPIMTCYKLVVADFKWFGLQSRIERLIQQTERKLFFLFHRMLVCSLDKWYSVSLEEIRCMEKEGAVDLYSHRPHGSMQGMVVKE